jgi:hypothetical protein
MLLAATVALLAATALAATAIAPPPTEAELASAAARQAKDSADEELIRNDLGSYTEDACLTRDQATALFRSRLDALGFRDWTIRTDDRIREARCVTGAAIGDAHEVLLMASMGGDVAKVLDTVSDDLMRTCLGRDEAVAHLRAALVKVGLPDPDVVVGGPRGIPLVNGDAYVQHMADGCYVYGGAQFDDVGRYTWFISGP